MKLTFVALVFVALVASVCATAMPSDQKEAQLGGLVAPPSDLKGELNYDQYMGMTLAERRAFVAILSEVMAMGGNSTGTASAAEIDNLTGPWDWIKCKICKKLISELVSKVSSYGCGKISLYSASICEFAGLGPEDPLSDLCVAAVVVACPILARDIAKHVTSHDTLCKDIKFCK